MTWNQKCSEVKVYYVRIFTQSPPPLVLCALPSNVLCALVHNERLCCVNISPYWRACCVLCALPSRQPQSYCCDQHLASNHPTTQPHKRPNQQPTTNQQALQRPGGVQGFSNFGELYTTSSCAPDSKYDGNDVNIDDNYNHTQDFPRGSNLSKLRLMKCTPGRLLSNSIARGAEHSNTNCLTWIEQMNTDEHR